MRGWKVQSRLGSSPGLPKRSGCGFSTCGGHDAGVRGGHIVWVGRGHMLGAGAHTGRGKERTREAIHG